LQKISTSRKDGFVQYVPTYSRNSSLISEDPTFARVYTMGMKDLRFKKGLGEGLPSTWRKELAAADIGIYLDCLVPMLSVLFTVWEKR
jgi:hypothetical protein